MGNRTITKIYDVIIPDSDIHRCSGVFLIIELMDTDLEKYMSKKALMQLDDEGVVSMIYQVLCGLAFLHSAGVMHRDLKPSNILLSRTSIKLCDFGLARPIPKDGQKMLSSKSSICKLLRIEREEKTKAVRKLSEHTATRWYRAPEVVLMEKDYSTGVDLWGAGCIFGELFSQTDKYKLAGVTPEQRFLFPGDSSFPLSLGDSNSEDKVDQI